MIKFTDIINESNRQEYKDILTMEELDNFIKETTKILPNIVRDALYLVKKYGLLDASDINTILDSNKSSIPVLAKRFDMDENNMEELWNIFKDLKSNVKLFPHFLSPHERMSLIKGTALIEDLTLDLTTSQGKNDVVRMYTPLVNKIVNQYVGKSKLNRGELMSSSMLAFTNSMNDWDRSNGQLFKTYLSYRVQQQILNDIDRHSQSSTTLSTDNIHKDIKPSGLVSLGLDDHVSEFDISLFKEIYIMLEKKFKQRDLDIFYRFFGLNGYKKEKSRDIAKMYGMTEENMRSSVVNKILAFLKKDSNALDILMQLTDCYNESIMIELMGCDELTILERLSNDDIYILLEEITKWNNKDVFKRALANSIDSNNDIILDILNGGFEEIDNNIKRYRKEIIRFLSNMYPTDNMNRKTDVDIIEYMMELQEIYKKHKI